MTNSNNTPNAAQHINIPGNRNASSTKLQLLLGQRTAYGALIKCPRIGPCESRIGTDKEPILDIAIDGGAPLEDLNNVTTPINSGKPTKKLVGKGPVHDVN